MALWNSEVCDTGGAAPADATADEPALEDEPTALLAKLLAAKELERAEASCALF